MKAKDKVLVVKTKVDNKDYTLFLDFHKWQYEMERRKKLENQIFKFF